MKIQKTNAMRTLEFNNIPYKTSCYEVDESDLSGIHGAKMLGISPDVMFKTLVTRTDKNEYRVFMIPVDKELDLKKCAVASGDKRVEMIAVKELLPLTGYVRGGCSPIGMKKQFNTYIDETAILFDEIYFSAGARGVQIILNPEDLINFLKIKTADLVK
jgi:Cys-tRNA(Pro)/Cys-tRNA(Cys) deacylase